jgi:sterol desaturase/sphingolipid hydroxylase (fatty acid hydroxylase superfamily)
MTLQELVTNVGLIAAAMSLVSLVELAVPLFARGAASEGRAAANFGLTGLTLVLNWAIGGAAAALALFLSIRGGGVLAPLGLSLPVLVAISVVTLDLSTYLAHRSMHLVPLLWRAHRVHHSDPFLDVSSTLRQHPLEGLWRFLWIIVPTWMLGLPLTGVVVYRLLSVIQAVFEHANIRLWRPLDRTLSLVWVTPNMHKVHHSRARKQTDSNYGNLFACFDRGLRTFRSADEAYDVVYGLDDVDPRRAKSFAGLMALPFVRASSDSPSHALASSKNTRISRGAAKTSAPGESASMRTRSAGTSA